MAMYFKGELVLWVEEWWRQVDGCVIRVCLTLPEPCALVWHYPLSQPLLMASATSDHNYGTLLDTKLMAHLYSTQCIHPWIIEQLFYQGPKPQKLHARLYEHATVQVHKKIQIVLVIEHLKWKNACVGRRACRQDVAYMLVLPLLPWLSCSWQSQYKMSAN